MDSCATSIFTSYLHSIELGLIDSNANQTPSLVLPLLNIPREDLRLREDIEYLLDKVGIESSSLPFIDDLTKLSPSALAESTAFLVDHNQLLGIAKKIFGDRVVGVIDHHVDAGLYKPQITSANGPRIIEPTGSCSSLATNYFNSRLDASVFADDDHLALLALGPLLADTSGMTSSKVQDPDRKAFKIYKKSLKYDDKDVKKLTKTLDTLKSDVSKLTGLEILRKDYKEWAPEDNIPNRGGGKFGISSMVKSLNWLFDTYPDFENDLGVWGIKQGLDVMVLNCSYKNPDDGKRARDLLIWSPDGQYDAKMGELILAINPTLELSPLQLTDTSLKEGSTITLFHQGNTKATRKVLAPLFQYYIQGVPLT